jgi:hypothetical protein
MSTFVVNLAKTTLVFTAIVVLASVAYPSTISSFNISTSAAGGTPCSVSGSGAGSASCESTGTFGGLYNDGGASVTVTDNSLEFYLSSEHDAPAQAFASVTHDDFYSVPVNGPVSALEHLTCSSLGPGAFTTAHFSLGSTNVSPPVESIFPGVSQQGSGLCGNQYQFAPLPTDFVVSLLAANNIVDLQTHIDASGRLADFTASYFVQITVDGFLDANGNPIVATLLTPAPGTLGTFALAVLLGVGVKWARSKTGSFV